MESSVVTTKGQVVIPVALRRRHKIEPGTKICFFERDGEIVMQPITDEFIDATCGIVKSKRSLVAELIKERRRERAREDAKVRRWQRRR